MIGCCMAALCPAAAGSLVPAQVRVITPSEQQSMAEPAEAGGCHVTEVARSEFLSCRECDAAIRETRERFVSPTARDGSDRTWSESLASFCLVLLQHLPIQPSFFSFYVQNTRHALITASIASGSPCSGGKYLQLPRPSKPTADPVTRIAKKMCQNAGRQAKCYWQVLATCCACECVCE